jgi:dTDP-4-amino-4,6-dideoxygalactose transaminase
MLRVAAAGTYVLGAEVAAFEGEFAAMLGATWAVGVANGTDAIELALRGLGIGAGDTVITPSHTAIATVSAVSRLGARPLFVDVDADRYTVSPSSLDSLLATPAGEAARALIVVHLYGTVADMPALLALTDRSGIPVIEDCAQAHGATLDGRPAGTWGKVGCFSFYPTKNLGALGDGGAVVGNEPALGSRIRILRQYGWSTERVSEVPGINSRLDEIQAAILRAKLPYLASENQRRREIATQYDHLFAGLPLETPMRVTSEGAQVFHQYVVKTTERDRLRALLRDAGIGTLVHYPVPAHLQPAYANSAFRVVPLGETETVARTVLSLPMFPELADEEVRLVAQEVAKLTGRC